MIFRSRITDENASDFTAHCEPALTVISSVCIPDKPGKPRAEARRTATVFMFSRHLPGLVAQYKPLVQSSNGDLDISFDSIVNSLQKPDSQLILRAL